jgi:K+-sensing histidine kinase KdpD
MRIDPFLQARRPLVVTLAAAAPVAACAVLSGFRDSVANTNAALGLVLLVVAAAATGIRPAGVAAALSSALWFNFFLTVPYYSFTINDRADVETAVLLVGVGLAVSEIALWGRRQQARASRDQGYLHGVLNTAAAVSAGLTSGSALVAEVQTQLTELLRLDRCRFVTEAPEAETALAAVAGDGTVVYGGRPLEVARRGLPTDTEIALPARSGGVVRGWYLLTAATRVVRPSADQLRVAVALADQVGAALADSGTGGRPSGVDC